MTARWEKWLEKPDMPQRHNLQTPGRTVFQRSGVFRIGRPVEGAGVRGITDYVTQLRQQAV